jgi:hypothetical protein
VPKSQYAIDRRVESNGNDPSHKVIFAATTAAARAAAEAALGIGRSLAGAETRAVLAEARAARAEAELADAVAGFSGDHSRPSETAAPTARLEAFQVSHAATIDALRAAHVAELAALRAVHAVERNRWSVALTEAVSAKATECARERESALQAQADARTKAHRAAMNAQLSTMRQLQADMDALRQRDAAEAERTASVARRRITVLEGEVLRLRGSTAMDEATTAEAAVAAVAAEVESALAATSLIDLQQRKNK